MQRLREAVPLPVCRGGGRAAGKNSGREREREETGDSWKGRVTRIKRWAKRQMRREL